MNRTLILPLAITFALSLNACADDESHDAHHMSGDHNTHQEDHGESPGQHMDTGSDAVSADAHIGDPWPLAVDPRTGESLLEADHPVTLVHEGRELRFASEESAEQFAKNSEPVLAKADTLIIEDQKPRLPQELQKFAK